MTTHFFRAIHKLTGLCFNCFGYGFIIGSYWPRPCPCCGPAEKGAGVA